MPVPLVSIIIPVYNAEEYLKEAIDSIINQSYKKIEIIIVNDGSEDNTDDVINSYADHRITILNNDRNKGICYSLNRGIKYSSGVYIARMDGDDISTNNRIYEQVNFLENNKEYDIVFCRAKRLTRNSNVIGLISDDYSFEEIKAKLFFRNIIIHSSGMFRSAVLKKNKYNRTYFPAEDYYLWILLSDKYKIKILKEPLIKYRYHYNSVSRTMSNEKVQALKKVYICQLDKLNIRLNNSNLIIHLKYLLPNYFKTDSESDIKSITEWLLKLINKNEINKIFEPNAFNKEIIYHYVYYLIKVIINDRKLKYVRFLFNSKLFNILNFHHANRFKLIFKVLYELTKGKFTNIYTKYL